MAQIVTITNPLTGQPAQVDQLEHTAQQIDDAIARALPGGAIDITLANKAPAGYGLGVHTPTLISDCNRADNGWYRVDASTANIPDVGLTSGVLRIDEADSDLNFQSLYFYSNGYTYEMKRRHFNGVWYPWEWVNPPMAPGVEYRTTERYQGKPVYIKLVDFGALPNNSSKVVSVGVDSNIIKNLTIDLSKSTTYNQSDEYSSLLPLATGISNIHPNNGCVLIRTSTDRTNWTGNICVKYTKATD